MDDKTVILLAVASAVGIDIAERERVSCRYSDFDVDSDVFDRIFGQFPGDYIVEAGSITARNYDGGFYGRLSREDFRLIPEPVLHAEHPVPGFASLRSQMGGRIRGHQVLVRRRPVSRRS
jgi:hypothetical protein